jgi:rubrerythrin
MMESARTKDTVAAPEPQPHLLNSLLRGEISAVETYQQALSRLSSDPASAELQRIHDEHREAANTLRQHIHGHGGQPEQGSGAWGLWAKAVEGTAGPFGHNACLKALKEGEEYGASSYESALQDPRLAADCKTLILGTLLPQTRAHISMLDHLMSTNRG